MFTSQYNWIWKLKRSFAVIWYSSKYSVNTGCFGITQTRRIIQTPFNTECLGNIDYVLGTFFALTGKTFKDIQNLKDYKSFAKNIYDQKYFRVHSIFWNHWNYAIRSTFRIKFSLSEVDDIGSKWTVQGIQTEQS